VGPRMQDVKESQADAMVVGVGIASARVSWAGPGLGLVGVGWGGVAPTMRMGLGWE
jgi:hypothetical protein